MHIPGCQKNGAFHIGIQKNWAIHILFVEKRGPVIYLAVLKKGAIRHAHPYYAIYRKLTPSPAPEAYPLGITWIDCDICVITSKKWVQKVKGQYMNRSTFWMIKYMNGSVFSKARYMNGVGFEILARTPVPKLPLSYHLPTPENTPSLPEIAH